MRTTTSRTPLEEEDDDDDTSTDEEDDTDNPGPPIHLDDLGLPPKSILLDIRGYIDAGYSLRVYPDGPRRHSGDLLGGPPTAGLLLHRPLRRRGARRTSPASSA